MMGAAAAAVLLFGAGLRVSLLNVDDYRPQADEGAYHHYASALALEPKSSLRGLVDSYLADENRHRFPSPMRAGHIALSSVWMRLQGRYDLAILSCLSTYFAIATLALGYAFTRGLFGPGVALGTLALLAASPLHLALGRRVLQDAVVGFFILVSLFAFHQTLRERSRAWAAVLSLAFFAAIMSKESSVLLLAFFAPWLAYKRPAQAQFAALALLAPLAAAGLCWLWICGGPDKFLRLFEIVVSGPSSNPYVLRYQSGSVLRYLGDFFLTSPFILCLGGAAMVQLARDRSEPALFLAAFFAAEYLAFSCFAMDLRYVLALDYPLRVFAVLAVWRLSGRPPVRVLAVLGLAAVDLFLFRGLFLDGKIYDPVTVDLVDAWKDLL